MGANPRLQERFLKAYESHGTISAAARESGVSRQSHYEWMANDEAYCNKFKGVRCVTCQRIEDSLVERLANGWEEAVYQGGECVGYKRRFDNGAAISYLDRHDPDFIKGKKQNVGVTSNSGTFPTVQFMMPSNGRNVGLGEQVIELARTDPEYLEFQRQKMLAVDTE